MAISERINPDNLNIQQFQEVPEINRPELPFDVERDINPNLKDKIKQQIINIEDPPKYCQLCIDSKILWPDEQFDDGHITDFKLLNYLRERMQKLESRSKSLGIFSVLSFASQLVTARPQIDIEPSLKKSISDMAEQHISQLKKGADYFDWLVFVSLLKKFNPSHKLDTIEEDLMSVRAAIEKERSSSAEIYALNLANLRYIDSDFKPQLTENEWKELHKLLNKEGSGASIGATMKILTAHKIEVTAPGVIDIQMHPPVNINQSTPPIPETRKF